jgi:hypothetical protein
VLRSELGPTIRKEQQGREWDTLLALHNNASPRTAAQVGGTLSKLTLDVLEHNTQFRPRAFRFPSACTCENGTWRWSDCRWWRGAQLTYNSAQTILSGGTRKLPDSRIKWAVMLVDYVERWRSCNLINQVNYWEKNKYIKFLNQIRRLSRELSQYLSTILIEESNVKFIHVCCWRTTQESSSVEGDKHRMMCCNCTSKSNAIPITSCEVL